LEIVLEVSDVRVGRGGGGTACLEEDELAEAEVATELRFEEVLKKVTEFLRYTRTSCQEEDKKEDQKEKHVIIN